MEIAQKDIKEIILVAVKGKMEAERFSEFSNNGAIVKNGRVHLLVDLSSLDYLGCPDLRVPLKAKDKWGTSIKL